MSVASSNGERRPLSRILSLHLPRLPTDRLIRLVAESTEFKRAS